MPLFKFLIISNKSYLKPVSMASNNDVKILSRRKNLSEELLVSPSLVIMTYLDHVPVAGKRHWYTQRGGLRISFGASLDVYHKFLGVHWYHPLHTDSFSGSERRVQRCDEWDILHHKNISFISTFTKWYSEIKMSFQKSYIQQIFVRVKEILLQINKCLWLKENSFAWMNVAYFWPKKWILKSLVQLFFKFSY